MRAARLAVPAEVSGRRLLADRGTLIVDALFYLLVTSVLASLWRAAAGHHRIAGYTGEQLTWYITASEAAICAIDIRLIEQVGEAIGKGGVAVEMLRPVPAVAVRLAVETGRAVARLGVLLVAGGALAWATAGPPPSWVGVALAIPSLVVAIVANLGVQHVVAAAAFWIRDTRASWFLYQKFIFILGGMLLPLEVLPGPLEATAKALPFMAMAYAPARQLGGHTEAWLLGVQVAWAAAALVAAVLVFAAGQRRLQAVGG